METIIYIMLWLLIISHWFGYYKTKDNIFYIVASIYTAVLFLM